MTSRPATPSLPRTVEALGETILLDPSGAYVESRSHPGTFHRLTIAHGRAIMCDCPGFTYRHTCRHLAAGTEALAVSDPRDDAPWCGCWEPQPFERGSDLWGCCKRCGGYL